MLCVQIRMSKQAWCYYLHIHTFTCSLLTCGVILCAARMELTQGVLIRLSCGLCSTVVHGSDICCLKQSKHSKNAYELSP